MEREVLQLAIPKFVLLEGRFMMQMGVDESGPRDCSRVRSLPACLLVGSLGLLVEKGCTVRDMMQHISHHDPVKAPCPNGRFRASAPGPCQKLAGSHYGSVLAGTPSESQRQRQFPTPVVSGDLLPSVHTTLDRVFQKRFLLQYLASPLQLWMGHRGQMTHQWMSK